ncbi:MAG: sigma-70 family RNA polymerase sigma factor [Synergistaceae bacterium]|nr:sigma-70 family RNA polymerase sigma factor [Synergistaceae bacterium]
MRGDEMMEAERELELWSSFKNNNDLNAREELIVAYRPLVFWIAKKINFNKNNNNLSQDLIQEGMLALIHAVDKFEPERGFKFATYAFHRIRGQMINMLERSEKRAPLPVADEILEFYDNNNDNFERDDDWLNVSEIISRLPGREAEIVSALFFEHKEPKDIASEKKIDISHVYRLRRAAVARIKLWLGLA